MTFQAAAERLFAKKGSYPTLKLSLLWYNSAIFPARIPAKFGPLNRGNFRGSCSKYLPTCQKPVGVSSCSD